MSLTSASCALAQAGASNSVATCSSISALVSSLRLFHLSRLMAVTTLSQPPSGMGIRCVETSHQPAE